MIYELSRKQAFWYELVYKLWLCIVQIVAESLDDASLKFSPVGAAYRGCTEA